MRNDYRWYHLEDTLADKQRPISYQLQDSSEW